MALRCSMSSSRARVCSGSVIAATLFILFVISAGCDSGGREGASYVCGDGKVDPGEECDSGELVGRRCEDFGFRGGFLGCTQQCTYDFSMCIPETCGDGRIDSGEECDGTHLRGHTCEEFGYSGGTLACLDTCRLDYSGCEGGQCGNGIREAGEECDGTDMGMRSCATEGFAGGVLGCTADCRLDTGRCEEGGPVCGNGVREAGEECDGLDLGDATGCESLGYYGGALGCRRDCSYDLEECRAWGKCGDGLIQGAAGEQCDLLNIGDHTCGEFGYSGGLLGCTLGCEFDFSGCEGVLDTCGNGVVEDGEDCDDGAGNSDAPDAHCRTDCHLARCGDGIVDSGEECDGTALGGHTCLSFGYTAGILGCYADCHYDYSACEGGQCGNYIVEAGEECDDGTGETWDGCRSCEVTEFQVNTAVSGSQRGPRIGVGPDGSFVIVWGSDTGTWDAYGQRYDRDGSPVGVNFMLNDYTASNQAIPSVGVGPDGSFVAVWNSDGQDGNGNEIYGQRFSADGSRLGEFRVNTTISGDQSSPGLAMNASGDFVVVWRSGNRSNSIGWDIYARRYSAQGTPLGDDFRVNQVTQTWNGWCSVAMAQDGRFVVVWNSDGQSGDRNIYMRLYSGDGSPMGDEIRVNEQTAGDQQYASVAMSSDGTFVVVWDSYGQDGDGYGIYGRLYSADGNPLSGEFRVNSHTGGNQQRPTVAMAPDGRFVVVWQSDSQDGDGYGVFAQVYEAGGTPDGTEMQLNVYTVSSQQMPFVAMGPDGSFVVTWESDGQDGSAWGIYAQRFTPDGTPLGHLPWP